MGSVIGYQEAHGPVATFETDVAGKIKKIEANIEPVQDLHGYDYPWPAGGGKNILPYPYYSQDGTLSGITFSTAQDGKITASGTTTEGVNFFLERDISLAAGTYTLSIDGTHTALTLLARNPNAGITLATIAPSQATATFTLAETTNVRLYFNTSVVGASVSISAYVQLEAGSTATSYAPYSNICPITGWTVAKVERAGKNLANCIENNIYSYQQCTYSFTNGGITVKPKEGMKYARVGLAFDVKAGRSYTISLFCKRGTTKIIRVGVNDNLSWSYNLGIIVAANVVTETLTQYTKTVTPSTDKIGLELYAGEGELTIENIQLELVSTATEYEPYVGSTYDITFPSEVGTVYGGTLDIISGQLTVDKAIVDLGTLTWSKSNLTYFKSDSLKSVIKVPVGQKTPADMVCSKYATLSYGQVNTGNKNGIAVIGDTSTNDKGLLTINDLALVDSTAEDFKASLSGTMLAYKVKSPITYSLTPQEIQTIIGTNNIYANTGDTSVLYPKIMTPVATVSNVNLLDLRRGIIASQPHLDTISGASLSFKSAVKEPESLIVNIEPIQSGTGNPSPDNIRPISGRTKATVTINGTVIEINFPSSAGTVYGGRLDLLSGELIVDRTMITRNTSNMVNLDGNASWPGWRNVGVAQYVGRNINRWFYNPMNAGGVYSINTAKSTKTQSYNDQMHLPVNQKNNNMTLNDWKPLALDIQMIIPLANPITYQLDPITIELLKGNNTITADCGNTTITYWTN